MWNRLLARPSLNAIRRIPRQQQPYTVVRNGSLLKRDKELAQSVRFQRRHASSDKRSAEENESKKQDKEKQESNKDQGPFNIPKGFEGFFKESRKSASRAKRQQSGSSDKPPPQPPPGMGTWLPLLLGTGFLWALTLPSQSPRELTWEEFRTLLLGTPYIRY